MNILIGTLLTILTTGFHAVGMILAMRVSRIEIDTTMVYRFVRPLYIPWFRVSSIVLLMFMVSLMEVALWATAYRLLGAFDTFEPAVYFSMVTFTTLGYGEIVLDSGFRLLASCEAAIGIIMFGWTTAIVIASVQRFYFQQEAVPKLDFGLKKSSTEKHKKTPNTLENE